MSLPSLSPHHRAHHPPMHLRPCLKSGSNTPVPSLAPSPCPTPGLQSRGVHFPSTDNLHRVHPALSRTEYDRSPIAPPSEVERSCAMPARGCPGKTYDPYMIDRVRPLLPQQPQYPQYPGQQMQQQPTLLSPPALTFSSSSSSEESDEPYSHLPDSEPIPAYTSSVVSPRHASPSYHELQFLPHAPSKSRRSGSPAGAGRRGLTEREMQMQYFAEEDRRREMRKNCLLGKAQPPQWSEWSADDDGSLLGGF